MHPALEEDISNLLRLAKENGLGDSNEVKRLDRILKRWRLQWELKAEREHAMLAQRRAGQWSYGRGSPY